MISISLCMIVKNEENVLARCLDSVKDIVDEIIIVDTGSQDKTKEIAMLYTDKVLNFRWIDDFAMARNYSFLNATKDYVIWLDADDILLENDRVRLMELKKTLDPTVDIVMMKYNLNLDEQGNPTASCYRERLLKRSKNYLWRDPVHEYIELKGNIINSEIAITHRKDKPNNDRNLRIFKRMISRGRRFNARNVYYFAKELYYNKQYAPAAKYYKYFLEGKEGWVEDNIYACYELSQCYKYMNDSENQLKALLNTFKYDIPRPEICCELGYYYKNKKELNKAIFWFETALRPNRVNESWAFVIHECWGFIPSMELCVCYYELGDTAKAIEYNNWASRYKPQDSSVIYNKDFFVKMNS